MQENYRGRTEGNKWKTSTGFRTLHCFMLGGNKNASGDFVRGCISRVFTAHRVIPTIHLLDIDCAHQTDQSRRTPAPSIFDGFTKIMKKQTTRWNLVQHKSRNVYLVNLYHENRGTDQICFNKRGDSAG